MPRNESADHQLSQPTQRRQLAIKTVIVLLLLLPLVLTSSTLLSAPENGYRIVAKFQSSSALPGETVDNEWGMVPQWFPGRLFDTLVEISSGGWGDLDSGKNTYRLFYNLVPIRKLNLVFVI